MGMRIWVTGSWSFGFHILEDSLGSQRNGENVAVCFFVFILGCVKLPELEIPYVLELNWELKIQNFALDLFIRST